MIIKIEFVKKIRLDDSLLLTLAKSNGVRVAAIERWLRTNNKILTTAENLAILGKYFLVDTMDLLAEETIMEAK